MAVVSVGITPTKLGSGQNVQVQNLSAVVVFVGGANVTADTTATGGIQLPATMTAPINIAVPGTSVGQGSLYGIVATGTANVAAFAGGFTS